MARHSFYRDFEIWHARNSTPPSDGDWGFSHVDYDGAEDANDGRLGSGYGLGHCMAQIDAMLDKAEPRPVDAINDGGPAFPYAVPNDFHAADVGMSLRAHAATEILAGMGQWMPQYNLDGQLNHITPSLCCPAMLAARAEWAVAQADALIAALATRKTEGA